MNGKTPTLISGVPNVAPSLATIRSHASASPSAPASTWPLAAQIVGLPSSPISAEQPRELVRAEVLVHERDVGGEAREVAAAGEHLLVRRGQHDAAHGVVVARALEGRDAGRRAPRRRARCASRGGRARSSRRRPRRRSERSRGSRRGSMARRARATTYRVREVQGDAQARSGASACQRAPCSLRRAQPERHETGAVDARLRARHDTRTAAARARRPCPAAGAWKRTTSPLRSKAHAPRACPAARARSRTAERMRARMSAGVDLRPGLAGAARPRPASPRGPALRPGRAPPRSGTVTAFGRAGRVAHEEADGVRALGERSTRATARHPPAGCRRRRCPTRSVAIAPSGSAEALPSSMTGTPPTASLSGWPWRGAQRDARRGCAVARRPGSRRTART